MVKTCDVKSYELAEHFMQDDPQLNTKEKVMDLALNIQQAVADWFDHENRMTVHGHEPVR